MKEQKEWTLGEAKAYCVKHKAEGGDCWNCFFEEDLFGGVSCLFRNNSPALWFLDWTDETGKINACKVKKVEDWTLAEMEIWCHVHEWCNYCPFKCKVEQEGESGCVIGKNVPEWDFDLLNAAKEETR